MPVVYVLNFSDDPYINIIFPRTIHNRLFFSPRNPKYILTEPQMSKTVFKSLQRQRSNQTFKYRCNPVVFTDCTGQFYTKYAAICRKVSTDWTSIIPIFDNGFDHHQDLYLQRLSHLLQAAVYFKEKSCFCLFEK